MGVQVLSYDFLSKLSSSEKLARILETVKKGEIVMIEGRLTSQEETDLISMALDSLSGRFSGVEIAFLDSKKSKNFVDKIKDNIIKLMIGNRVGVTVVGPSKIVKQIKMDPNKLEILLK